MEDSWSNFYSGNADLVALGMPVIECRKTLCEVRSAIGRQEHKIHGMLMPRSAPNANQLTLPSGTRLGATSWIVAGLPDNPGLSAEYIVFMTFMRDDVPVNPGLH
jgi:hypothetical protein